MLTLAVDTTAEFGSLALVDAEGTREEVALRAPDGFSGVLFQEIAALLARQDVSLQDIELFAGASGPGSFTGVRIGLAAVKGLGEVLGRRVVGVSNLEALASLGEGELRAAVIDARRGEVYAGLFDRSGQAVLPEMVTSFAGLLELLGDREFEWVASGFDPVRGVPASTPPRALAAAIARVAIRRLHAGGANDPAAVDANYVRRPDAEIFWKG